ncbi:MAG: hypothetical protein AAF468_12575 [Pseudomonadota bacterium]
MRAKVKVEFQGCPDGELHPRVFKIGEIGTGSLARVAIENKWALPVRKSQGKKADDK